MEKAVFEKKKIALIQWQLPMKRVLYALIPLLLASVYFFGWNSLLIVALSNIAGFFTEYLFVRSYKEPVTSAVFVTSTLLALSLPPTVPLWMAVVGTVFAVAFGKMVFGGFGRNIFNPALTGRAFLYVSFGLFMTGRWVNPFQGLPGGFGGFNSKVFTGATPLNILANAGDINVFSLFLGNISGSLGETSSLLIMLGGIYLIWKKAANYRIVVSGLFSAFSLQYVFYLFGIAGGVNPIYSLLSGGFLFGIFFFATDPITSAQTDKGRWIFGALVGILSVIIRCFSVWPEGIMFAVLLGNMFAPITDYLIREAERKRKAVSA